MVSVGVPGLQKTDPKEYGRLYQKANNPHYYLNGGLDSKSAPGKGFIAEVVVAKALNLESGARCNCTASFNFKYDLLDSGGYGEINVKSSKSIKYKQGRWVWLFGLRNKYKPDTYIFVAYSDDHKDIAHVWIVPADANIVTGVKTFGITNTERRLRRVQEFEVDNTMYNVYLHTMSIDRCSVLKKPDFITEMLQ